MLYPFFDQSHEVVKFTFNIAFGKMERNQSGIEVTRALQRVGLQRLRRGFRSPS